MKKSGFAFVVVAVVWGARLANGQVTPIPTPSLDNGNAATIVYDAASGNVSVLVPQDLSLLDLRSQSCQFQTSNIIPENYRDGRNEVVEACRIFDFRNDGFTGTDIGPILPPGLSMADLLADLTIAGFYQPPFGEAFGLYEGRHPYLYGGVHEGGVFHKGTAKLVPETDEIILGPNLSMAGMQLAGAVFASQNLSHSSFAGSNLNGALLSNAIMTEVNLFGADLANADLSNTTSRGFSREQLYSTASYQRQDLRGIGLADNVLADWNFSGQDIRGANFSGTTSGGFTWQQLSTTASFQEQNLRGVSLRRNDLTGWDFAGQDMANADLRDSTLTGADLSGSNLKNVFLVDTVGLSAAVFSTDTVYNQWTWFPEEFDPAANGLTFEESSAGDFDANDSLDATDIDLLTLTAATYYSGNDPGRGRFDLNNDSQVDQLDRRAWIKDTKQTWFGDANLDGEFNSSDLTAVFQAAQYEDASLLNSAWATGDWNGDLEFDTSDLVAAFQDGGYEAGSLQTRSVPEPSGLVLVGVLTSLSLARVRSHSLVLFAGRRSKS
ncbi:MAG: pentapeptide repeat-containing protein [Planctomycetales bacterium]|nr:pentapeptide repeat-containing protein [Planctomycetales bacterium]